MCRRLVLVALVLVALLPGAAHAADLGDVANLGYSTSGLLLANGCWQNSASGFGVSVNFGTTCDAGYTAAIDTFIAGHPERKLSFQYPDAVAARSRLQTKGYSVSTDYAGPNFAVTGDCNVNQTANATTIVSLEASLSQSAPCPAPAPTPTTTTSTPTEPTPTTTTTVTEPTPTATTTATVAELEAKIAELERKLAALAGRMDAIQKANIAAWDAHVAALDAGKPPYIAALAARSAGLNAIYGL